MTFTLHSKGEIILVVPSCGITSMLLLGGMMAHSRFGISLSISEDSICNILQGSNIVKLIRRSKLIILEEGLTMHRYYLKVLNRTLMDIFYFHIPNSVDHPFGGKCIIYSGDFYQNFPFMLKDRQSDVVHAYLNSFSLWHHYKVV